MGRLRGLLTLLAAASNGQFFDFVSFSLQRKAPRVFFCCKSCSQFQCAPLKSWLEL